MRTYSIASSMFLFFSTVVCGGNNNNNRDAAAADTSADVTTDVLPDAPRPDVEVIAVPDSAPEADTEEACENLLTPFRLSANSEEGLTNKRPEFRWDAAGPTSPLYPITYRLVVDNNADFSSPEVERSGLTNTNYVLTESEALPCYQEFHAFVEATTRCSQTLPSWPIRFTVGPTIDWTFRLAAEGESDERAVAACFGTDGALYVTGQFNNDIWLARFNSEDGSLIWQETYDHDGDYDFANGIVCHSDNNIYVAGGVTRITGRTSNLDIWVGIFNNAGELLDTITPDPAPGENSFASGIALDEDNNIFLVGTTGTSLGGSNTDIWLGKVSPDGVLLWDDVINSTSNLNDHGWGVAVSSSGNSNFVGCVGQEDEYPDSWHSYSSWLSQYNDAGEQVWTEIYHDDADSYSCLYDLSMNLSDDSFYVIGNLSFHAWLANYSNLGSLNWSRSHSLLPDTYGIDIVLGFDNQLYVTGGTSGSETERRYAWAGIFSLAGEMLWHHQITTTDTLRNQGTGIAVDRTGNFIVAGYEQLRAEDRWHEDIFIRRYNTCQ